ncbi:MAG TPA: SLC13 family permease, partial [bacterium]|nr:SLC13 family permease [bacterium]
LVMFLPLIYLVLRRSFPSKVHQLSVPDESAEQLSREGVFVLVVTAVTIVLWVLGPQLGLAESLVALIPIIAFYVAPILREEDFKHLSWDTLILFGGGIALGEAVKAAQVDVFIADQLGVLLQGLPLFPLYLAITATAIVMTVVASNTGAAILMIPIMIPLARTLGVDPRAVVLLTTCGVSLDFILPIGTPPSAIAYAVGTLKTKEMVRVGLIITSLVVVICSLLFLVL